MDFQEGHSKMEPVVVRVVDSSAGEKGKSKGTKKQRMSFGIATLLAIAFVVAFATLSICQFEESVELKAPVESDTIIELPKARPGALTTRRQAGISPINKNGSVEVTFTTKNGECRIALLPTDKKFLRVTSDGPKLSVNDLLENGNQIPTRMALPKSLKSYPCPTGDSNLR